MTKELKIGAVAELTGLSVKAIRFYESSGFIPPAARSESGYRLYNQQDVRRLRLVRGMRALGVPLDEIRPLLQSTLTADCAEFTLEVGETFDRRRTEIDRQIAALEALRSDLDDLARHVAHCECEPGQAVSDCGYCEILDGKEVPHELDA